MKNMSKKSQVKYAVVLLIIAFVLIYMLFSFIEVSVNIFSWHVLARILYIILSSVLTGMFWAEIEEIHDWVNED